MATNPIEALGVESFIAKLPEDVQDFASGYITAAMNLAAFQVEHGIDPLSGDPYDMDLSAEDEKMYKAFTDELLACAIDIENLGYSAPGFYQAVEGLTDFAVPELS